MADWIDVNEEQFTALEALGAPTRVVHQAKVPKTWDVSALGGNSGCIKRPKTRVPHKATTKYRLTVVRDQQPIRADTNLDLAYKAIVKSMGSDLKVVRSRESLSHTVGKTFTDLDPGSVSSMISIMFSRGYLVVVDA